MNPYTPQRPLMMDNMQDVSGQKPVFMNESAQEQMHRALLQQNLGSPATTYLPALSLPTDGQTMNVETGAGGAWRGGAPARG